MSERHTWALTDQGPRDGEGLTTAAGRLAAWAAWFGLEPAPVRHGRGRAAGTVIMDQPLLDWMIRSGGSLDWFVTGDVRGMAVAFFRHNAEQAKFADLLRGFDKAETLWLEEALRSHLDGGEPLEEALTVFRVRVEAHRAAGGERAHPGATA